MTNDSPEWHSVEGHPELRYRKVDWSTDLALVRELLGDYRRWIADHADPKASSTPGELPSLAVLDELFGDLPGAFGPPTGRVLLWYAGSDLVACGVLREQEPTIGELKRIFIRPDYRGEEFGKPFVRTLIAASRELGYRRLRSYTLGSMASAIDFHQELGFHRIPAYWPHPAAGTVFFELDLAE